MCDARGLQVHFEQLGAMLPYEEAPLGADQQLRNLPPIRLGGTLEQSGILRIGNGASCPRGNL